MKKLFLTSTLAVVLVGYSLIPQYYDNNEYELFARLETSARLIQYNCNDDEKVISQLPELIQVSELLYTYTKYTPQNDDVHQMAKILRNDINEFNQQYITGKDSVLYCTLKMKTFIKKTNRALEAIGKKERI